MRIKHWMPGNVPAELRNNSERLFSLIGAGKIGSAFVLWRSRIAVGGEFAVPDRIFALLAAIIHRTNGAVGLHEKAVFAGLFEAREKDKFSMPPLETSAAMTSLSSVLSPKLRRCRIRPSDAMT